MSVLISHATTRREAPLCDIPDILAQANARAATIIVRPCGKDPSHGIPATVVKCSASSLWMALSDEWADATASPSRYTVVWWIDGVQYGFESTGMIDPTFSETVIRLEAPARIEIVERRRVGRRPLRDASRVRLELTDRRGDHDFSASLMNVSPHGLACRLATPEADTLSVGARLVSVFSLEPNDQTFALPGRIVNITQGGTPGQAIIGIEFTGDEVSPAQEEALSAALTGEPEG